MPEIYPAEFPQALLSPYSWDVDMGVLRTPMDGGLARQRRLYDVMPHAFQVSFIIPLYQLTDWQTWVSAHAYDYIEMQLLSWLSGGACSSTHFVRFTSNLSFGTLTRGQVSCKVAVELSPAQVSNYMPPVHDQWIIGGTPDVPSSGAFVIAGNPDVPSSDTIVAGTPDKPSL